MCGETTTRRRNGEHGYAAQKQSISLDNPLHVDYGPAESSLNRGQCHIHDGAVDEGHAGSQDRDGEDPRFGRFCARDAGMAGLNYRLVAWWLHELLSLKRTPVTDRGTSCHYFSELADVFVRALPRRGGPCGRQLLLHQQPRLPASRCRSGHLQPQKHRPGWFPASAEEWLSAEPPSRSLYLGRARLG